MSIWCLVCPCKTKKKEKIRQMEEKRNDRPKKNGTVSEKHAFKKPGGEIQQRPDT